MKLDRHAREFYQLDITTEPTTALTDWSASFDRGATWVPAQDIDGNAAWLVAGPDADPEGASVITRNVTPKVRLIANPEVVVRNAPAIQLTT